MKVAVLGATGKFGQRLAASCLARGHKVTAAARQPERIKVPATGIANGKWRAVRFDGDDLDSIDAILADQDAVVSAAGNIADGQAFVELFDRIVSAAERTLGQGRRIWMVAGAAVLDIPYASRIVLDLPFVPKRYRPHRANWQRLERSMLDWAMICPGSMAADDELPAERGLSVTLDTLPFGLGPWARIAPPIALSLMMKANTGRLELPYSVVADIVADHLTAGDRFGRRRVGAGWSTPSDKASLPSGPP